MKTLIFTGFFNFCRRSRRSFRLTRYARTRAHTRDGDIQGLRLLRQHGRSDE